MKAEFRSFSNPLLPIAGMFILSKKTLAICR